ncbi:hypothetical protein RJ639_039269 [Escallonia herrerae]|uniref:Xylanase inhibitor N-terminal domain-containing protein n=1 Tax=Escallonia herrerae TaxID=1293975 RepID=A0AA88WK49_9ASTE|nr:hypothetical protein RJ639_039269 [Escallonia herrerae]
MVETPDDIRGLITMPGTGGFLVSMYIGELEVHQFLLIDTDGTSSSGNFATEKLKFFIPNEGATFASNVLFGCGRVINEPHPEISGVMGLGYGGKSVATQIGTKFSYCIGSIRDPYYAYNRLIIGNGAKMIGTMTPLDLHNHIYYLTLERISVGRRDLPISRRVFQRTRRGNHGVIIDSGS